MSWHESPTAHLVAPVAGLAAALLVPVLDDRLVVLEQLVARGMVTRGDAAQVRAVCAAIRVVGRAYTAGRASAHGGAEVVSAEVPAASTQTISSDQAADLLGVSVRWARQLLGAGLLDGRKVSGVWVVDRASVLTYINVRGVT